MQRIYNSRNNARLARQQQVGVFDARLIKSLEYRA